MSRLRRAVRRTAVLRATLAVGATALLVAAGLSARHLRLPEESLVPQGRSGVIALDMSRSINGSRLVAMRRVLTRFAQPGERVGLVMFSDTGYTLLPPGTPGTQLRPLLAFLRPFRQAPHSKKFSLPATPWDEAFRGGTRVSAGLIAARAALLRHGHRNGAILLVSDLNTLPDDLPRVADAIVRLRAAGIPLRIVALRPAPSDRALFERLAGKSAFVPATSLGRGGLRGTVAAALSAPLPGGLVGAAVALLALLALNELWCGRLLGPLPQQREARA